MAESGGKGNYELVIGNLKVSGPVSLEDGLDEIKHGAVRVGYEHLKRSYAPLGPTKQI
jgi:hypothetical protein